VHVVDSPESRQSNRRVRNPETFRERALKAATESEKPKRSRKIRSYAGRVLRPVFGPIGRFLKQLFGIQPFKSLAWLGKWVGRILFPRYLRNSWRELTQVTWPNWRQSRQLTFAVLVFAVVFGGAIALVDYGLDKIFKQVLLK
jgi:preprotein translocase SecE subunit